MAGDWIKMRGNLWDDPRVAKICDLTDCSEAQIIGGLYWLWATADQHTENGIMPGLTLRQIDRKTGIQGFGSALCDVGWLADHPEGVRIVKFEEHNGQSAKRRASDAQRKANIRNVSAPDADNERTDRGQTATECGAREREEKEKEKEKKEQKQKTKAPALPSPVELLAENGVEEQVAKDWLAIRTKKRLPLTKTALDETITEAIKAGMTLDCALRLCCKRGWAGFEAAWVDNVPQARASPGRPEKFDPVAHVNRNRTRNQRDERTIDIDEFGEPIQQVV